MTCHKHTGAVCTYVSGRERTGSWTCRVVWLWGRCTRNTIRVGYTIWYGVDVRYEWHCQSGHWCWGHWCRGNDHNCLVTIRICWHVAIRVRIVARPEVIISLLDRLTVIPAKDAYHMV